MEIGGNRERMRATIILARDYAAINAQFYAATIEITEPKTVIEIPWKDFKPMKGNTQTNIPPISRFAIKFIRFPNRVL